MIQLFGRVFILSSRGSEVLQRQLNPHIVSPLLHSLL